MGVAARRLEHEFVPSRPRLKVVRGASRRTRSRSTAAAESAFRAAVLCMVVLALAGVARVSLAARAAEATIDAWELRGEVKEERLRTRALEADRSALAAPSRIESLAAQTLNMTRPAQVCYLQLCDPVDTADVAATEVPATAAPAALTGAWATLMDLAASEAQVLLVGDMGLGSLR